MATIRRALDPRPVGPTLIAGAKGAQLTIAAAPSSRGVDQFVAARAAKDAPPWPYPEARIPAEIRAQLRTFVRGDRVHFTALTDSENSIIGYGAYGQTDGEVIPGGARYRYWEMEVALDGTVLKQEQGESVVSW